jgi:uncharacterized protein YyaL (SSP411 family)
MTQDQENVTSMMEATLKYLDKNNSVWSSKAALGAAIGEAQDSVQAIRDAASKQETPLEGITDEKAQKRGTLEDLALEIADQISAFAAKSSDVALTAQAHVSRSSLDQAQDNDLVQTAERIRDAANTNVAALADYGVTAAEVTALSNAITAFSAMKAAPRIAKASKSGATQSIASLVQSARSLFRNQIDKLMTPFRKTNPEFYTAYFAARVIVNRAATQSTPPPAPPAPAAAKA